MARDSFEDNDREGRHADRVKGLYKKELSDSEQPFRIESAPTQVPQQAECYERLVTKQVNVSTVIKALLARLSEDQYFDDLIRVVEESGGPVDREGMLRYANENPPTDWEDRQRLIRANRKCSESGLIGDSLDNEWQRLAEGK